MWDVGSERAMTSREIRVKLPKPLYLRSRKSGGAMRAAKAVKPGFRKAGVEKAHEG